LILLLLRHLLLNQLSHLPQLSSIYKRLAFNDLRSVSRILDDLLDCFGREYVGIVDDGS